MNAPAATFAAVGYDEALARANALVPALRERAARGEAARQMLPETEADLHRTGLFRFAQPKRYGGMELDFVSFIDIPAELARGCPSTAWNVGNLGIHHWMLALYDERAQDEVWGANPDALIASGIAFPQGRAKKVDGGFSVSGHWNFSSGVDPSEWNMLAAQVYDGDRVTGWRMCLVHRSEYEIVDDWNVLGMRATGSKSVRAKDVFVPEYRALDMVTCRGGAGFPGRASQSEPALPDPDHDARLALPRRRRARQRAGGARADVRGGQGAQHELHRDAHARLPDRAAAGRRGGRADRGGEGALPQRLHRRTGSGGGRPHDGRRGEAPDQAQRRLRDAALHRGGGLSCTRWPARTASTTPYPIQRIFRDAHSLGAHIGFAFDAHGSNWGLVALGGDFASPTL